MTHRHQPMTGYDNIDNHHQELFQLVSMLDLAISKKRDEIEKIIVFLEHYVEEHFHEEEHLMLEKDFNGYQHHKDDHEIFKARVHSLRHDFDNGLAENNLYFAIRMFIDKLVHHIQNIDILIAELHSQKEMGNK
jgi:hemerythrin